MDENERKPNNTGMLDPNVKKYLFHVVRGAFKGFALYFIPICILRRRITGVRRSIALGAFVAGIRAIERGIQCYANKPFANIDHRILKKYRLAIAGGIASVLALKIDNSLHESSIVVFWCLIRALRCVVPEVPLGSTLIMCAASTQILSSFIMAPLELSSTYVNFLNVHGGQSKLVLNYLPILGNKHLPCEVIHPGLSCIKHFYLFFIDGILRATRVYFPLYLAFYIFSRNKSIINLLKNVLRSSAFLSAYCALSWLGACMFFGATKLPVERWTLLLHCWLGGFATLFERPSRRPELAVYCATYAVDSIYRHFRLKGVLPRMPWLGLIIMIGSFATMLHHINQQPAFLKKFLFRLKDDEGEVINYSP